MSGIARSVRILSQAFLRSRKCVKLVPQVRNSHTAFNYRELPPPCPKWHDHVADGLNAFMWWWILVHCWYQWGHVVGEYDWPEPEKWSDQELGLVDINVDE